MVKKKKKKKQKKKKKAKIKDPLLLSCSTPPPSPQRCLSPDYHLFLALFLFISLFSSGLKLQRALGRRSLSLGTRATTVNRPPLHLASPSPPGVPPPAPFLLLYSHSPPARPPTELDPPPPHHHHHPHHHPALAPFSSLFLSG